MAYLEGAGAGASSLDSRSGRPGGADPLIRFSGTAARVESALQADLAGWLPRVPGRLAEATRYALLGPGKRIRPVLLLWSARLAGSADGEQALSVGQIDELALPAAVAIEMVHTYSLVHDDLPGMDDDAVRRGRPTCHVAFGEGLAILVGDALLTRAFEVLAGADLPAARIVRLTALLSEAAGGAGMVGGQAEDLAHEGVAGDVAMVQYIHEHKTADLFAAACRMGAAAAGAGESIEQALGRFGRALGLAFQICDDLLDAQGRSDRLGKQAGRDRQAGKLTYPSAAGIPASRQAAERCLAQADEALTQCAACCPGADKTLLEDLGGLVGYVAERMR